MSQLFNFGDLQFSSSSENILGSGDNGKVFKGTFKGKSVAVKELDCTNILQDEQWENLIELRYEHLVPYYQCDVHDNIRYLVMELCQGSMLDYCRKTLDQSVASYVKGTDVMWQITCAVDYLHRQEIDRGNFKLQNVLFWIRDSKFKRVIVKLTGYGYNSEKNNDRQNKNNRDTNQHFQLGCLFYSAATKNTTEPIEAVPPGSLTKIDNEDCKVLASKLIRNLTNPDYSNRLLSVSALLKHPLFIRCSEDARSMLIKDEKLWKDNSKFFQWEKSLDKKENMFCGENVDDLKYIFLSFDDATRIVNEANQTTPHLFSEYIWHIVLSGIKKTGYITHIQKQLGKGSFGEVKKCEYVDENYRTRRSAACKTFIPTTGAEEIFNREIETLRKLNHLFIVKYFDVVEQDSKKYIVMELCDGSLKDYVEGKLEGIPKDSLDEKILIGQIALGLGYIHDKGIIHKDLKLENILLKRQSCRLVLAKIADFGIAKEKKPGKSEFSQNPHPETQLTRTQGLLNANDDTEFSKTDNPGTETYMAPELLNAEDGPYPNSFASDVYAFGITIARFVRKGQHPFSYERLLSMSKGLVPPNLQEFSWDLIDLILKLTNKDPGKRPKMSLVLRHPYFVLTNDQTKWHFTEEIWKEITSLPDEEQLKQLDKVFSSRSFREWYETISNDKPKTTEEVKEMEEILSFFRLLRSGVQADILFPAKEYEPTIKDAIKSQHDANVENKIIRMIASAGMKITPSLPRFYKLIQRAPNLFVPYLFHHLLNIKNHLKQVISELEWSNLYFDDEEVVDELWNIKYSEKYENSPETIEEIIKTVGKCEVSERVWSSLLNWMGIRAAAGLLCSAVKSYASNAPKVTKIILKKYGITKEMAEVIHLTARNEGDWATEILEIVLKYGGNPNAISNSWKFNKGSDLELVTAVHFAARNESLSGPKMMKLLLENGGSPNPNSNPNELTPIHLAALNQGDYAAEILKLLIDSGGLCNSIVEIENYIWEPIHLATANMGKSATELVDLLLKKRNIKLVNNFCDGKSLVHWAVYNNGVCGPKIVEKLLQKGADPNSVDEDGVTPVHLAAGNDGDEAIEKLQLLLAHGGKLNTKDKNGLTPVHWAFLNIGICGDQIRKLVGANYQNVNVPFNETEETILHLMSRNTECKIEQVQVLLENGGDPNAVDIFGCNPVHFAVINSSVGLDVLKLLLESGGDANLIDKQNLFVPVHYAANSESTTAPDKMKFLLKNGGDANAIGKLGMTPLHLAATNSGIHGPELTRILLQHGGNPNVAGVNNRTPLHGAILNDNDELKLDIAKALLEKGANPNAVDKNGETPVHCVIRVKWRNSSDMLTLLLANGGKLDIKNKNGFTPVHWAFLNIGICGDQIRKLVGANEQNVNVPLEEMGETLLHWICGSAECQIQHIHQILNNGGDPNAVDNFGRSPVHYAVILIQSSIGLDILQLLLEKGGEANLIDKSILTPVHYAAESKNEMASEQMKILLENGGDANAIGKFGATPLHHAAKVKEYQNITNMKILLEKGGDPNLADEYGSTPVHWAAENPGDQALEKLKLLLAHGGELDIKNKNGFTPVHFAFGNIGICGVEIRKLVGANYQNVNVPLNEKGETILHLMSRNEKCRIEQVQQILANGGDPNAIDFHNRTPLHGTILNENDELRLEIAKELLKKGANPNAGDKDGRTPVHYVIAKKRSNSLKLRELLLEHGGNILQEENIASSGNSNGKRTSS